MAVRVAAQNWIVKTVPQKLIPRLSVKLTQKVVDSASPKSGQRIRKISDASSGLVLVVKASGPRVWWFDFMCPGRCENLVLGAVAEIGLSEPRKRAQAACDLLARGLHPGEERRAQQRLREAEARTLFSNVFEEWLQQWRHGKSERHVMYTRRRAENDLMPYLEKMRISQINAPCVLTGLTGIERRVS